jgi:hypothetical protein
LSVFDQFQRNGKFGAPIKTFLQILSVRKCEAGRPGTDVMIFKIFSPKNSAKKLAFLTQNKAKVCKILIITLVFEKNAIFFATNCRKSPKIVIITSTPDWANWTIVIFEQIFSKLQQK